MPSDKRNWITAKDKGLIFSLFDVALGAFWYTAICTMHSSWNYWGFQFRLKTGALCDVVITLF